MRAAVSFTTRFAASVLTLLALSACQQPPQIVVNANSSADKTFTSTETTTSRSAQIEAQPPAVIAVTPNAPAQPPTAVAIASSQHQPAVTNAPAPQPPVQPACRVNDPNDTYVNLRQTPNGTLVGPVNNGTSVQISGYQTDSQGRNWAAVMTSDKRVGYMAGWMIACS